MRTILLALALVMFVRAFGQGHVPGVPVTDSIVPNNATNANFSLMDTVYIKGGVWTGLEDVTWLTNILRRPNVRKEKNQLAILTNGVMYQLGGDLTTWTPIAYGKMPGNFSTLADLTNAPLATNLLTALVNEPGRGGDFYWVNAATNNDRGVNFLVNGGAWRRKYELAYIRPEWWGAVVDDGIDDTPAFQAAVDFAIQGLALTAPYTGFDSPNLQLSSGQYDLTSVYMRYPVDVIGYASERGVANGLPTLLHSTGATNDMFVIAPGDTLATVNVASCSFKGLRILGQSEVNLKAPKLILSSTNRLEFYVAPADAPTYATESGPPITASSDSSPIPTGGWVVAWFKRSIPTLAKSRSPLELRATPR